MLQEPHSNLRMMLETRRNIMVLGAGLDAAKPAHRLFLDLQHTNWSFIPVHPLDKGDVLGNEIQPSALSINADIAVFFLSPQRTMEQLLLFDNTIPTDELPFIWLQPGAANEDVLEWLNAHDVDHVVDECIVEFIQRHGLDWSNH